MQRILIVGGVAVLLWLAFLVGLHALVAARGRRAAAALSALAKRRAGRFDVAGSCARIHVEHAIVHAYADTLAAKNHPACTRARAVASLGAGPRFSVHRRGAPSRAPADLSDVVLGDDRAFDERFVVSCDDALWTRRLWTHRARRLLANALPDALATCDGRVVTVALPGLVAHPSTLDAMVDLAGELASAGTAPLAALHELPGASFVAPSGAWNDPSRPAVRLASDGGDVDLVLLPGQGAPRLAVSLARGVDLPPFSADLARGRPGHSLPRGLALDASLLERVGDATLSGNRDRLRLVFAEVPSHDRIEAAARLLRALGVPHTAGAYR